MKRGRACLFSVDVKKAIHWFGCACASAERATGFKCFVTIKENLKQTDGRLIDGLREACEDQFEDLGSVRLVHSVCDRRLREADACFPDVLATVDRRHVFRLVL